MHERDILLATLEIVHPEEREAFLAQVCGDDAQLRSRVDALLRASQVQDGFLESPAADTELLSRETDPLRQPCAAEAELSLDFLQPADDPSALGRLGPYPVTEVIGRGGMGVVLKAHDTKLNRVVAIKVLAPELASNPTARKRFQREAHAAAAVVHQHVVTIHAVDEDRVPYLVMEYIDGQSLKEKIDREGNLKLVEILRIGQQVASGLAAAHAHGLMHRDVKPANILLENGIERVRITDFGLARAVDDVGMTRTGEVAGTPEYMSPEQAQGLPMDGRSDLFSFGCVLYAMCTGRPPFRAETVFATARRVCE
ncbi:MAG TPA: serine/threonine-protein kinase, partial [Pirellulaceae bacterium]|nr:serine/threonine-protein kinase [Pirellulaceae bacterium]